MASHLMGSRITLIRLSGPLVSRLPSASSPQVRSGVRQAQSSARNRLLLPSIPILFYSVLFREGNWPKGVFQWENWPKGVFQWENWPKGAFQWENWPKGAFKWENWPKEVFLTVLGVEPRSSSRGHLCYLCITQLRPEWCTNYTTQRVYT